MEKTASMPPSERPSRRAEEVDLIFDYKLGVEDELEDE